ncbi:AI-2E family transporter, partial [Pseudonocardia ailaonensis]|uniref:AI-2E family transporter n=1 Tax=Pseudonocardia ailaonensis TaxID=367279 RepID=UPI0031D8F45E
MTRPVRAPDPRMSAPAPAAGDVGPTVPRILRVSGAIAWRVLAVAGALYVLGQVVAYLAAIVVPVAIALLLAALLSPAVGLLQARRVPRGVATALVVVAGLAALGAILTFVVITFVRGVPALAAQLSTTVDSVVGWLATGPLKIGQAQLAGIQQQILDTLNANQAA